MFFHPARQLSIENKFVSGKTASRVSQFPTELFYCDMIHVAPVLHLNFNTDIKLSVQLTLQSKSSKFITISSPSWHQSIFEYNSVWGVNLLLLVGKPPTSLLMYSPNDAGNFADISFTKSLFHYMTVRITAGRIALWLERVFIVGSIFLIVKCQTNNTNFKRHWNRELTKLR